MADETVLPFSVRNCGAQTQIDNDCPEKVRIGLIHIIHRLDGRGWLGWPVVAEDVRRLAGVTPTYKNYASADAVAGELLLKIPWDRIFDFCEHLHNDLPKDMVLFDEELQKHRLVTSKSEIQRYISDELRLLFVQENLAFEFSNGLVQRRGRRHTADKISRAGLVLGDPKLSAARFHFNKALGFFRNVSQPDFENAVKEAVSAVEAAAQVLFSTEDVQLDKIIKSIAGSGTGKIPKPIANTFYGLYGFRGSGKGVAHGNAGAGAGAATKEIAEYALAVAASQIVFLVEFSSALEPDVPFQRSAPGQRPDRTGGVNGGKKKTRRIPGKVVGGSSC